MPGFPFSGRLVREHDERVLDMVLSGQSPPQDAPREMHDLADMLASLAGPAEPGLLAGETAARAAFTRALSPVGLSPAARPARRRHARLPAPRRARLATALVAVTAVLGSTAAAYTGMLPATLQNFAHRAFDAPAVGQASQRPAGHDKTVGHPARKVAADGHGRRAAGSLPPGQAKKAAKPAHNAHPAHPVHPAKRPHPPKGTHPTHPAHPGQLVRPVSHGGN